MNTLQLADGRTLSYEEWGDPKGTPVFFLHGTGDSRLARHPDNALTAKLGIRLITFDRPGVGQSTRKPGRTLLTWVSDLETLADQLKLKTFSIAGWSGGGPHALAAAYTLGKRVNQLTLASPLAPFDDPATRKLVLNRDLQLIWSLNRIRFVAEIAARAESAQARRNIAKFVDKIIHDAPADKPTLSDPVLRPMFEEEMSEALAQGSIGVLDDMWAFLAWEFPLESVTQPVTLFVGDADEILDAEMASVFTTRLPNVTASHWEDGGHYAVFSHWEEFLNPLTRD